MARKKKNDDPVYIITGIADTPVTLSMKLNIDVYEIRKLNPDIRFNNEQLGRGRRIRIK